jgi:enoyl-CoA hydratase/carnithine racemase
MIKQCGDDPNVGALLITGAGTAFCAGGEVSRGRSCRRNPAATPVNNHAQTCMISIKKP